jgi:hypothetical protein
MWMVHGFGGAENLERLNYLFMFHLMHENIYESQDRLSLLTSG